MNTREQYYVVVRVSDQKVQKGLPTPALIQAGRGEAYYVPDKDGDGIWYLRDDARGYTPNAHGAGGDVTAIVRVIRNPKVAAR